MPTQLTLLEAVTLLRQRKPDDVSAEEVAGLRACLEANPALASMAGGADVVERYIAEVEAAIQRKAEEPAKSETLAPSDAAIPTPRNYRRIAELSLYSFLVLAGSFGLYFFLAKGPSPTPTNRTTAGNSSERQVKPQTGAPATPAGGNKSSDRTSNEGLEKKNDSTSKQDSATDPFPKPKAEPDDPNAWRGWRMTFSPGSKAERKTEWDRTDPSNPEPASALFVVGGPLVLAREQVVTPDTKWLMVHARPNSVAAIAGQIIVTVDGKQIAQAGIGAGQTDWPLYVPLSDSHGVARHIEVKFAPGNPKQEITYWNLQLVESQKRTPQPESPIIATLRSAEPAARLQGTTAAATNIDPFAVHALVAALKDSHRDVRKGAAAALARYNDDANRFVADALVAALRDVDQEVRKAAAASLMAFTVSLNSAGVPAKSSHAETVWEVLHTTMLTHPDLDLRLQIAQQLVGQKEPKIAAAYNELLGSPDDRLRLAAIAGLGQIPGPETTPRLVQALADPEPSVRRSAANTLIARNDPAAETALLTALASHPDGLIRRIVMTHMRNRAFAMNLAAIREVLKSPDDQLRRLVPSTLLNVADPESFVLLAQLLDDTDQQVRVQACEVLIRKRGDQADEILLKALSTHPDIGVRLVAMVRFYTISPFTPRAIELVRQLLKHPDSSVRYNALVALESIRRNVIERTKLAQPRDVRRDPQRMSAAVQQALAVSPGPEILASLTPMLDDPDPTVWEGAANCFCNDPTAAANPIVFGKMAKSQNLLFRRRAALHFANSNVIVPSPGDKEPLLALLKDSDFETRRWALKSISRLEGEENRKLVEQHLDDPHFQVREIAAIILRKDPGALRDDSLLPPVLAIDNSPQAVAQLVGFLQSPRGSIRQAAAMRLANIADPAAEEAMLQALQSHVDVGVRRAAAVRFAHRYFTPKVLGPARAALAIQDVQLRIDVLAALGRVTNEEAFSLIAPLAADTDTDVRLAAVTALTHNPSPAAEAWMLGLINSWNVDPRLLRQAAIRLGEFPSPRGLESLKRLLAHPDANTRVNAVVALSRLQDPSVVPALGAALGDADAAVRTHAVNGLLARTEPAVQDIMIQALPSHADIGVRRNAASWCQQHPAPQAVPALQAASRHDDDALRQAAAHALGPIAVPEATPPLVALIADPVVEVRTAAAAALAGRRDAAAEAAALQLLTNSPDVEVRRSMAMRFAGQPMPQAIAPLTAALKDQDDQLRLHAVAGLRSIQTPEAIEPLMAALTDASPPVRQAALDALLQRQEPRAQTAARDYKAANEK